MFNFKSNFEEPINIISNENQSTDKTNYLNPIHALLHLKLFKLDKFWDAISQKKKSKTLHFGT